MDFPGQKDFSIGTSMSGGKCVETNKVLII